MLDLLAKVANAGIRACFYQKWLIHRRVRPENFGGRVHLMKTHAAQYPVHSDLLARSSVLDAVYQAHGSYLLPMAYPEGSPLHPSYPCAHCIIAGACVTVLKAWFDESDNLAGLRQGEAVAIGMLADERQTYTETFKGFSLTKFDGTTITI
jgi:hypothetical protein